MRFMVLCLSIVTGVLACVSEFEIPKNNNNKTFLSPLSEYHLEQSYAIENNGFLLAGSSDGFPHIQWIDENGRRKWQYKNDKNKGLYSSVAVNTGNQILAVGSNLTPNKHGLTAGQASSYNENGELEWSKSYRVDSSSHLKFTHVIESEISNSYYAIGLKTSADNSLSFYYLFQIAKNGDLLFARNLDTNGVDYYFNSMASYNNKLYMLGKDYFPGVAFMYILDEESNELNFEFLPKVKRKASHYHLMVNEHYYNWIQYFTNQTTLQSERHFVSYSKDHKAYNTIKISDYWATGMYKTNEQFTLYGVGISNSKLVWRFTSLNEQGKVISEKSNTETDAPGLIINHCLYDNKIQFLCSRNDLLYIQNLNLDGSSISK